MPQKGRRKTAKHTDPTEPKSTILADGLVTIVAGGAHLCPAILARTPRGWKKHHQDHFICNRVVRNAGDRCWQHDPLAVLMRKAIKKYGTPKEK